MKEYKDNIIEKTALFFKVFGDTTRLRILLSLVDNELFVNDIATNVNMTKSAVSHQLKILKDEGLVKTRRDGKNVYYSLDDEHVSLILEVGLTHISHKENI